MFECQSRPGRGLFSLSGVACAPITQDGKVVNSQGYALELDDD